MTYGDLSFFQVLHSFTDPNDPFYTTLPESVDKRFQVLQYYPQISAHLKRVLEIPGIKKWVEERPVGLF